MSISDSILKHQEQREYEISDLHTAYSNYTVAISYYNMLRDSFLKDVLSQGNKLTIQKLEIEFLNALSNELTSKGQEAMKELHDQIQTELKQMTFKTANVKQELIIVLEKVIGAERNKSNDQDIKKRIYNFQNRFNGIIASNAVANEAYKQIINQLQLKNLFSQQMNSAEYGFLKRSLLEYFSSNTDFYNNVRTKLFSDHALIGYGKNIGGTLAEQARKEAINDVIKKLTGSSNAFYVSSEKGDSTNVNYDLLSTQKFNKNNSVYFNNLQNFLNQAQSLNGVSGTGLSQPLNSNDLFQYGIQSKMGWHSSLITSFQEGKSLSSSFFSIGSRINLAQSLGFMTTNVMYARGWHHSAAILSELNNLFQAVGQYQLGYLIKGQFMWMADLISTMRANNLYLTFYYTRRNSSKQTYKTYTYPTSGELAWQAPMYNYRELSRMRIKQRNINK